MTETATAVAEALADIILSMIVGVVAIPAATVTQTQAEVCAYVGGTYEPGKPDVCKDGDLRLLIDPSHFGN